MSAVEGESAPATGTSRPVRVLLWSARGSGEHYHGPASFTHRLYSAAPPGRMAVTLAHGYPEQENMPVFVDQSQVGVFAEDPFRRMRFIRSARRWVREHIGGFDVFHGMTAFHHSVLPAMEAQDRDVPAVLFIANHLLELADKTGIKALVQLPRKRREIVKRLAGLIAMSDAINEELLSYGVPERRIARIPMGVNTAVFRPPREGEKAELRREMGWRELPTLLFVGGITRRKRPDLLIEAAGVLARRGLDCQIVIAGPDHSPGYTALMKRRAEELGIASNVIWFGFTRDIAPLYRASDLFSLPSSNEGMAAALIEAMASGLPALVTPISGSADVVSDGENGRIISQDAAEIAAALSDYLTDDAVVRDHGSAASALARSRFSTEVVAAAHERLFRRVMAGGDAAE